MHDIFVNAGSEYIIFCENGIISSLTSCSRKSCEFILVDSVFLKLDFLLIVILSYYTSNISKR